ncbi:MAG: UDP-N-acetylmuramoyl-L-alanyl-D-glutamate--2,6-diaminopimelate ligase [Magnetococcales bacterium]|nr:UDP-N-acetylmuramoyl-L-alanyl-D-glutamate--2,6-diaminopimelate ligase [Magnetococcales bacterium]
MMHGTHQATLIPLDPEDLPTDISTLAAHCPGMTLLGPNREIQGLTADSRKVREGYLFAALPGCQVDGNRFIPQALAQGAVAVLHDGRGRLPLGTRCQTVAQLVHPEPRQALALLAADYYGHPAKHLKLMAVTGTNGKTSVAAMIEAILTEAGERVGVMGTTGVRYPGYVGRSPLTTPEPVFLQARLQEMAENQCTTAVLEVSSHALTQHRIAGMPIHTAIYTNLSRDHLDYHRDEGDYFQAKARLFTDFAPEVAIINLDDARGVALVEKCLPGTRVVGYSAEGRRAGNSTPVFAARGMKLSWQGVRFDLDTPGGGVPVTMGTVGRFNVANALAAAAACWERGVSAEVIARGLARFQPVRGRMETIAQGQPFGVVVDYAHTPEALERLLATTREVIGEGRIYPVFGCGGERDVGKRALMGGIAARFGEVAFITDDNPRSEDPAAIREAILIGCAKAGGNAREVADRESAIGMALSQASAGDAVVIAGKGHETVQITASGAHPFDDVAVACEHLQKLGFTLKPEGQR